MNILVLCDDRWHPAQTVRGGLTPLEGAGYHLDWIENAADWSSERMAAYPVVILSKSNNVAANDERPWMSVEVEQAFVNYVHSGNGLLVIHSGTAGYQDAPTLRALLGGVFERHPEQCQVTVTPVAGHPLAAAGRAFTCKDEHYFMKMDDPTVEVFLKSVSQHGEQPAGWTRAAGQGRVCVLTPGHNLEVWLDPAYQAFIRASIEWCAGAKEEQR